MANTEARTLRHIAYVGIPTVVVGSVAGAWVIESGNSVKALNLLPDFIKSTPFPLLMGIGLLGVALAVLGGVWGWETGKSAGKTIGFNEGYAAAERRNQSQQFPQSSH